MERGVFTEHDGRPAVRFQRRYPHAVERVWAAVSEPAGLAHWFPSTVRIEPRAGGAIEFADDPNTEPATGEVLRYEPPHALSFTWGGAELHFELAPDGKDGCTLTLTNVLEARDTAARNAAGWTVCLAELDKSLAGAATWGPHGEHAEPWEPLYDAYVTDGMPHGAPIPRAEG
ncbi:hypothetical protein N566_12625 [Streptomycetaceae bacterium MP113-05]|nr:hypothetical protein N566_12625 [Streptomycetaceae bacterium MP113-05]